MSLRLPNDESDVTLSPTAPEEDLCFQVYKYFWHVYSLNGLMDFSFECVFRFFLG